MSEVAGVLKKVALLVALPFTISPAPGWIRTRFHQLHLTESVYKVVLQKLIPAQIRQLILYVGDDKR